MDKQTYVQIRQLI